MALPDRSPRTTGAGRRGGAPRQGRGAAAAGAGVGGARVDHRADDQADLDAAYHEAAHAVVARLVGLHVHRVAIGRHGHGHTEVEGIDLDGLLDRTDPALLAAVVAELQATLAGRVADRLRGIEPGDGPDRDRAVALTSAVSTGEAERRGLLVFVEGFTERLVRRHWAAVDALARELAVQRELPGRRLDDVLRRAR